MKIHIDLFGCKDDKDVLLRLGEIFQFGGPKGNIQAKVGINGVGWGINWNACVDSLTELEVGGIWGSAKKVEFPLHLVFHNHKELEKTKPEYFERLTDCLEIVKKRYQEWGKSITYEFL